MLRGTNTTFRKLLAVLSLLLFAVACSRDPREAGKKYVDSGNKYFNNGKYREASIMYRRALQKDMRFADAWYRLGLSELRLGRAVDALRSLQRAVELDKTNQDAAGKLAEIYLTAYAANPAKNQQFLKESEDLTKVLLERDPKNFDGLRLKGYSQLANNDVKGAIENFQAAAAVKPFDPGLTLALVQSLNSDSRWEEAEKLALQLIEKDKTYAPMFDVLYANYVRKNMIDKAEQIMVRKKDSNPKNASFALQLAAHYYTTQKKPEMEKQLQQLLANTKEFPNARLLVGDFWFRVREFERAIDVYQTGVKDDPKEKASYQKRIVECQIFQGKKTDASQLIELVLKDNPKDNEALAIRASLLLQAGSKEQVQTAVNDLQSVVSRSPDNPVLRFNLARAFMAKGDLEQARVQLEEAIKKRPDYLLPRLALAQLFIAKQEYGKALAAASQVLEVDKQNLAAKLLKSSAFLGMKQFDDARAQLQEVLEKNPNISDAQFQLAIVNFNQQKFKEAEAAFKRLQQIAPNDPRGLFGLAEMYLNQKQYDLAIATLQAELAKNAERSDVRLALANAAARSEKYDLALTEFKRLLQKNPKDPGLHVRLGEVSRRKGDFEAAIASFKKGQELAPNDPLPILNLAMLHDLKGQPDVSKPIYEQVLKLDPDNALALNNLAFLMAEKGSDLDTALNYATKAKQKLPNNNDVADTLGWIYIKKNLADNAIGIFQDLIKKEPDRSTFHYHLGMALYQKGDKVGAKKALQSALGKRPAKEEESKIKDLIAKCG